MLTKQYNYHSTKLLFGIKLCCLNATNMSQTNRIIKFKETVLFV